MVYQAQGKISRWVNQPLLHVGTMSLQSKQRRYKFLLVPHIAPSRSATGACANVHILFESKMKELDDQGFQQMGCLTHYASSLHHSQVSHPREHRKVGVTEGHRRRAEAFVKGLLY
jgi:hypothetical protein